MPEFERGQFVRIVAPGDETHGYTGQVTRVPDGPWSTTYGVRLPSEFWEGFGDLTDAQISLAYAPDELEAA